MLRTKSKIHERITSSHKWLAKVNGYLCCFVSVINQDCTVRQTLCSINNSNVFKHFGSSLFSPADICSQTRNNELISPCCEISYK